MVARLDGFAKYAANSYNNDQFVAALVRGGPLDMAEYSFMRLVSERGTHVASTDGKVLRLHAKFEDGSKSLFTQIDPYHSAAEAAAKSGDAESQNELMRIAGRLFEAWEFGPREGDEWKKYYHPLLDLFGHMDRALKRQLRFHSLPVCYERERFMIVDELPFWARHGYDLTEQELIVKHFGGQALCMSNNALADWDSVLSGANSNFYTNKSSHAESSTQMGRQLHESKGALL